MSTSTTVAAKPARKNANEAMGTVLKVSKLKDAFGHKIVNYYVDKAAEESDRIVSEYRIVKEQVETGEKSYTSTVKTGNNTEQVTGKRKLSADEMAAAVKVYERLKLEYDEAALKREALGRSRTRISQHVGATLSIVSDEIVTELLHHGMKSAVASGDKMVRTAHLHANGVEGLSTYPLFSSLKNFKESAKSVLLEELAKKHAEELKKACKEAVKEFKLKNGARSKKPKKGAEQPAAVAPAPAAETAPAPEVAEPEEESVEDGNESKFVHYINKIRKNLLESDATLRTEKSKAGVKVASECINFVSDLLFSFIGRLAQVTAELAHANENKTISYDLLLCAIKLLMIDGHKSVEDVRLTKVSVPDPALLKEEEKKAAEAKKAGTKYEFDAKSLPQVPGYVAERVVSYPTSGYDKLAARIVEKLALIPKPVKKPAEDAANALLGSLVAPAAAPVVAPQVQATPSAPAPTVVAVPTPTAN